MRALVDERPEADAAARYEWASVHDFLGREAEAVPLYLAALDAGLDEVRRPQAVVQLASSLRNTGAAAEVVELLRAEPTSPVTGEASAAFLALALYDAGRPAEALQTALRALVPTLPLYRGALTRYVDELDA
ncbi:hypothetical protein D9V30_00955 [Mycetocola reblochoni]|nr:hypothetical protein D9V30_00955 [Mycetocola reblochoni]